VVDVLLFCFEISDDVLVVLERSRPGCPIQSLESPRDENVFSFKDDDPQPPNHEAWNQGEVVEARLLCFCTRRGVLVCVTKLG